MNKIVIFALGVATGSVGTYFAVKKVIESKTDEEIESVVKTFHDRFEKLTDILTDEQKEKVGVVSPSKEMKKDIEEKADNFKKSYQKDLEDLGYSVGVDLSEEDKDHEAEYSVPVNDIEYIPPYIIDEEHCGATNCNEETLILYADGILADENDEEITDPEPLIGNTLEYFEDEDERMFVRNESRGIEYTVLKSEKMFSDISDPTEEND